MVGVEGEERGSRFRDLFKDLVDVIRIFYIETVPSYGNSFWFQLGFYIIVLAAVLALTGAIMMFFGPYWWNYSVSGMFVSQVHFWSAEALVTLMIVHLFVNLSTKAYSKRKDMWVIGVAMLLLVFIEYAFGIGLNNNIVAQYNDKSAAGLWNALDLGWIINPEDFGAVVGWHTVIVPLVLGLLAGAHFLLAWRRGLTRPHRPDIRYSIVKADHRRMFIRAGALVVIVVVLGLVLGPLWANPFIPALDAKWAAQRYPDKFAATLLEEYNYTSGTATYAKFSPTGYINPYNASWDNITYVNTSQVYVVTPYEMLINATGGANYLTEFEAEPEPARIIQLNAAYEYFTHGGSIKGALKNTTNPIEVVAAQLTLMAQAGLYDGALTQETWDHSSLDQLYEIRLMTDVGLVHKVEAIQYHLHEYYMGMVKFNVEPWQIGSYWLVPYDALEAWGDHIPWWHTLYNVLVATAFFLVLILWPWIPGLRDLPDRLRLYKIFLNRYTIPEMRPPREGKRAGTYSMSS
ncbi:MAG: cytochrome b N-terminal domain-containing protein [Acidilobus sp.]